MLRSLGNKAGVCAAFLECAGQDGLNWEEMKLFTGDQSIKEIFEWAVSKKNYHLGRLTLVNIDNEEV